MTIFEIMTLLSNIVPYDLSNQKKKVEIKRMKLKHLLQNDLLFIRKTNSEC